MNCEYDKEKTFTLSLEDIRKVNHWYNTVVEPKIGSDPYYGAIGGGVTYHFTQTSVGVIITVTEVLSGEKLDLTDYDNW